MSATPPDPPRVRDSAVQRDNTAKPLRLFIAAEFPEQVRGALEDAVAALKQNGADDGLRWVRPEGVHLTLKFLGSTASSRVSAIIDALRGSLRDAAPFDLQPAGFGAFHGGKKAAVFKTWRESYAHNIRVLFVGLRGETDALCALAARIESAIAPLGFPTEPRPFFPHLTLARMREDSTREQRERVAAAMEPFPHASDIYTNRQPQIDITFPAFRVEHIALIESKLQPGGAVYRTVESCPLVDPTS